MSYQREKYQEYLKANGTHNTSPYCSCLDRIEQMLHVDIDEEFDDDKCADLLRILLEHRGNAADDAKKYNQIKNLISKLNKYCQFRNAPEQSGTDKIAEKKGEPVSIPQVQRIPDEPEEPFFNANGMTIPMEEYIRRCNNYDEFEARYLDQFVTNNDRVGQYLEI